MNNLIFLLKRSVIGLIIPFSIILLSSLILWQWPLLTRHADNAKVIKALIEILPVLPYILLGITSIMGGRYNNTGLIFSSAILAFLYFLSGFVGNEIDAAEDFLCDVTFFLLPVNLAYFSFLFKRRLFTIKGVLYILPIVIQISIFLLLFYIKDQSTAGIYSKISVFSMDTANYIYKLSIAIESFLNMEPVFRVSYLSTPSLFIFVCVFLYLLTKFIFGADANLAGLIGTLSVSFLGISSFQNEIALTIYFSGAGLILIITTIEASFKMAYIDDLTGLPGRRSLNEMLVNLGSKYAIAMVDVDHFKKFNDTYGHETGDQVLKMIASQFGKITGGGKSFRYGGEEFTAIFPGKSVEDTISHLEKFRKSIQDFPFVVRSKNRPKGKKKPAKKKMPAHSGHKKVKVTVSIGVCGPGKAGYNPEQVIKNADKALYKAKKSGRNCVVSK